jgi:hypothetical protein
LASRRGSTVSDDDVPTMISSFVADHPDQAQDREAAPDPADEAEDHEHEDRGGGPEGQHQQAEALERRTSELGHRESHAPEGAERRRPHDEPDHPEDDLCGELEGGHYSLSLGLGQARDGRGGEQCKDQHAQDLVLHERRYEAGGEQVVGDEGDDALVAAGLGDRLLGVGAGRGADLALEGVAGLDDVAGEQPERKCDDRGDEEVAERAYREAAGAGEVAERRDADHDGDEDDRAGDRLDQLDERVGQPLGLDRLLLEQQPEGDAEHDCDQHPEPQLAVDPAASPLGPLVALRHARILLSHSRLLPQDSDPGRLVPSRRHLHTTALRGRGPHSPGYTIGATHRLRPKGGPPWQA